MKLSLPESDTAALLDQLGAANIKFQHTYPGDRPDRQPVHGVHGLAVGPVAGVGFLEGKVGRAELVEQGGFIGFG